MAKYVAASTYGNDPKTGYRDPSDNNQTASGISNNRPGIARYDRKTLGGWYRVTAPNGKTMVVQQIELGPAPWTHAQVDINSVAARMFGYKQGNSFPTKQGRWKLEYLGKKKPAGAGGVSSVTRKVGKPSTSGVQSGGAQQELLRSYLGQRGNPSALLALAASMRGSGA